MKTIKEIIPLAAFGSDKLLINFGGETSSEEAECLFIDFSEKTISKQPLQKMLKFTPYEEIPKEAYKAYRDEIYKKFSNDKIISQILEEELV